MNDDNNAVLAVLNNQFKPKFPDIDDYFDTKGKKEFLSDIVEHINNFSQHLAAYVTLSKQGDFFSTIQKTINHLQKDFTNQLDEEKEMVSENVAMGMGTKLVIAGGVLLVLGIAVAFLVNEEKKKKAKLRGSSDSENQISKSKIKYSPPTFEEVKKLAGISNSETPIPPPPTYQPHHLLLIMPANQLTGFSASQNLTKDQIEHLIKNAARAYCYAYSNAQGKNIADGVVCADEAIDVTSDSRIYLQISLSANPAIKQERTKLGIISRINPDATSQGKIHKLAKLQSARSTQAFFDL